MALTIVLFTLLLGMNLWQLSLSMDSSINGREMEEIVYWRETLERQRRQRKKELEKRKELKNASRSKKAYKKGKDAEMSAAPEKSDFADVKDESLGYFKMRRDEEVAHSNLFRESTNLHDGELVRRFKEDRRMVDAG